MNNIRFQCPACGKIIVSDAAGKNIPCPFCTEWVNVPLSPFSPGVVIAGFTVGPEIGRSETGIVYKARQISPDRPVALKILSGPVTENAGAIISFIRETRAAAKLDYPHIARIYDSGEENGIFYVASEYVEGTTMKDILSTEHRIPVRDVMLILDDLASALDCAWTEQHLVHWNIKPENVMLNADGCIKLTGFGMARTAAGQERKVDETFAGTPQYVSPEILLGANADIRSDIYSLGATVYHFITGILPYPGSSMAEIAKHHLNAELIPPDRIFPEIPPGISAMIVRMMSRNPNRRYQTPEQLLKDIRRNIPRATVCGKQQKFSGLSILSARENPANMTVELPHETIRTQKMESEITAIRNVRHSSIGLRSMRKQRNLRDGGKLISIIVITLFILYLVLAFVKWLVWMPIVTNREMEKAMIRIREMHARRHMAKIRIAKKRIAESDTACLSASVKLLDFARQNPGKINEIRQLCADFFFRFREPDDAREEKAFAEIRKLQQSIPQDQ